MNDKKLTKLEFDSYISGMVEEAIAYGEGEVVLQESEDGKPVRNKKEQVEDYAHEYIKSGNEPWIDTRDAIEVVFNGFAGAYFQDDEIWREVAKDSDRNIYDVIATHANESTKNVIIDRITDTLKDKYTDQ